MRRKSGNSDSIDSQYDNLAGPFVVDAHLKKSRLFIVKVNLIADNALPGVCPDLCGIDMTMDCVFRFLILLKTS